MDHAATIEALLAEYDALKKEQVERLKVRDNFTYVTLAAVAAATVGAFQAHVTVLLLAVPVVCVVLGWTRLVNDQKVSAIGQYLETVTAPQLTAATGTPVLGWETGHRNDRRRRSRKWLQLAADLITFVVTAVAALVAWPLLADANMATTIAVRGVGLAVIAVLVWQIVNYADITPTRRDAVTRSDAPVYLVWSNKHHLWWKQSSSGYTPNVWTAGRYDEAAARAACSLRTKAGEPPEVMVLAPEHGRPQLTVAEIVDVDDFMSERVRIATTAARLETEVP